jgi:hypothetical protein
VELLYGLSSESAGLAEALIAGKAVPPTRKQFVDLQAAVLAALRKRDGQAVVGEGNPARWLIRANLK